GNQAVEERQQEVVGEEKDGRREHEAHSRRYQPPELLGVLEPLPVGDVLARWPTLSQPCFRARGGLGRWRSIDLHEHSPLRAWARANVAVRGRSGQPTRPPRNTTVWARPPLATRTASM